jgi:hypothetical protein
MTRGAPGPRNRRAEESTDAPHPPEIAEDEIVISALKDTDQRDLARNRIVLSGHRSRGHLPLLDQPMRCSMPIPVAARAAETDVRASTTRAHPLDEDEPEFILAAVWW